MVVRLWDGGRCWRRRGWGGMVVVMKLVGGRVVSAAGATGRRVRHEQDALHASGGGYKHIELEVSGSTFEHRGQVTTAFSSAQGALGCTRALL